ncbi:TonB-dependent receptor [Methyloligella sp. 2.7D]|uniref:TonB-dependent receptor n=1 Tax=unclassified Methyloligella TaxID=2625955 RepID=UPI001FEF751A|nr:TonB-dependent receptor [Methyloligella sp. GL2]
MLFVPVAAHAQATDTEQQEVEAPATDTVTDGEVEVPPVEVIQEQPPVAPPPPRVTTAPRPAPIPAPAPVVQPPIEVVDFDNDFVGFPVGGVPMSPYPGSEIPLKKVPSGTAYVSGQEFARQKYIDSIQTVLEQRVPSLIVDDLQGNSFQTNIQYRGFESSPVQGVAQGLAVYQNGIRINESFGDIVNYDFLPEVAIQDIGVVSGNPVYGLNALGGAITIQMKDGFTYHGAELTTSAGSYGRVQGSAEIGMQSGNWAVYYAAERISDDGYRDFSASQIRRMYGDIGFKNSKTEIHANVTVANNDVGVTASAPVQLLSFDRERTFTSPQTTANEMVMPSITASYNVNDDITVSGVAYYRHFKQSHLDGNISEAEPCDDDEDILCMEGEEAFDLSGNAIPTPAGELGSIDSTGQTANSWGTAAQLVNRKDLFNHGNQFLIGASYDQGDVDFNAQSELAVFQPRFVVKGTGTYFGGPDEVAPKDINTQNKYFGLFFSDTFDATDRLSLTVGGRYNYASIELKDLTGEDPALDGTNVYERFNPAAGLTYQLTPNVTAYGGYSEANRAPVPAELACADPKRPCLIESFLVADPPLDQVVSNTWEAGLRGERISKAGTERLMWNFGLFRTYNNNDIVTVVTNSTRGYFQNGADTLRQGIEAGLSYQAERWQAYANYSYIRATYESSLIVNSPDNPSAEEEICDAGDFDDEGDDDDEGELACVHVRPGDRLPGVPLHRFKAGMDYWVTPKWKIGGDVTAASSQYLFGDEANQQPQLGGYWRLDLHTSYQITPRIQIFALANNVLDQEYGLFGTFFNLEGGNEGAEADPALGEDFFTNPRTYTPAPPAVIYGGAKIKLW